MTATALRRVDDGHRAGTRVTKEGAVTAHFHTVVRAITPERVALEQRPPEQPARQFELPAQRVYLLTGYYAPPDLLHAAGARTQPETLAAELDPDSYETTVPGLYCIGSAGFGTRTSDVFIENGLVHAERAVAHLVARLGVASTDSAGSPRRASPTSATRSTRTPDPTA